MKHIYSKARAQLSLIFGDNVLSSNVKEIRDRAFEALAAPEGEWTRLELDLAGARMVDSAGLNLLVAIVRKARAKKATVCARISSDNVRRTFSFTRLDQYMEVKMV
jgi:anti-anti-sigma factor